MRLKFTQMYGTYLYRTVFGILAPEKKRDECKALTRAVANAMIRACPLMRESRSRGYILRRSSNDGAMIDFLLSTRLSPNQFPLTLIFLPVRIVSFTISGRSLLPFL